MSTVAIKGRLLRWGNSYGLRLGRADVDRLRLHPGSFVEVKVDVTPGTPISALDAVSFDLGGDAADQHDELFAQAAIEEHMESNRGGSDEAADPVRG